MSRSRNSPLLSTPGTLEALESNHPARVTDTRMQRCNRNVVITHPRLQCGGELAFQPLWCQSHLRSGLPPAPMPLPDSGSDGLVLAHSSPEEGEQPSC